MSISPVTAAMFQGGGIKADKRQCRGPRVQTVQVNAGGRRERQGQDRGTQNQGEEGRLGPPGRGTGPAII